MFPRHSVSDYPITRVPRAITLLTTLLLPHLLLLFLWYNAFYLYLQLLHFFPLPLISKSFLPIIFLIVSSLPTHYCAPSKTVHLWQTIFVCDNDWSQRILHSVFRIKWLNLNSISTTTVRDKYIPGLHLPLGLKVWGVYRRRCTMPETYAHHLFVYIMHTSICIFLYCAQNTKSGPLLVASIYGIRIFVEFLRLNWSDFKG